MGMNHFIENDYYEFKKRYTNRIQNFKEYLEGENNEITFIIRNYKMGDVDPIIQKLDEVLKRKYPAIIFISDDHKDFMLAYRTLI